jgi:dihydrofolate synthase/folylpolyglutamate synthase
MPSSTPTQRKQQSTKRDAKGQSASGGRKGSTAQKKNKDQSRASHDITNYTTALKWLYEHINHERYRLVRYNERTFNLQRMRDLLDQLGNPHHTLRAVQIAGTKGKGSCCAMLSSMLQACGYNVGLYTSPHLIDLRERITIDGQLITYQQTADIFKRIAEVEPHLEEAPTFFEIVTAAGILYFAEQDVDVAILETGLGGRLDCTTVVEPLVTGMTAISLDHTNLLGDDLVQIAREKAGIFKENVPAISVEQQPEVAQVLGEIAEEVGTPLRFTHDHLEFSYRFEANRELGPHTRVCLTTSGSRFEHLAVPLPGEHQAHNCGLALGILDKLKEFGFTMREDRVIDGLAQTRLSGRMEQAWSKPRVIIDGAHNASSIQALIRALGAHVSYDSLVMIFGCGHDKDVDGMLKEIALGADKAIFTRAKQNPRAYEPEDLLSKFAEVSGKMSQTAPSLNDALKLAARAVSREDLIVVTGSFHLVGEARKYFLDKQKKNTNAKK